VRASPPDSLKLDAADLLRDVRDRLEERHPDFAAKLDSTHPAWLILQESAWMIETLSEQLDDYPWAVLQQFAHLLGAQVRPAHPAIGVLAVQPSTSGELSLGDNPGRWRFFAPQNESRGLVEFALAEASVQVVPGRITQLTRIHDGELCLASEAGLDTRSARFGPVRKSTAFRRESFTWTVLASAGERLEQVFTEAIEKLRSERRVGWLSLEVEGVDETVVLRGTIDVAGAFGHLPPVTTGGDVVGRWGVLDDSTWTPPSRLAAHPLLPRALRGTRPLAGESSGEVLLPDIPAGLSTADLLVRDALPAPAELAAAIWSTLVHLDTRLAPLEPSLVRGVIVDSDEPSWVSASLRHGAWGRIVDRADLSIAELEVEEGGRTVRVGWVGSPTRLRVFAIEPGRGVLPDSVPIRTVWTERFSDDGEPVRVTAVDFELPDAARGVLLVGDGAGRAALLNPLLVINAPVVRDGRRLTLTRAVPEPMHLLFQDIVDRDVLENLSRLGLDPSTSECLSKLRLSRLVKGGGEVIDDFQGIEVDPVEGRIVLNAPDSFGSFERFRRGERVHLQWYRRTDANVGNLVAGEIRLVEQAPSVRPRLLEVSNPLGTAHGGSRESNESVVDRVFGPQLTMPVTPADWERVIRRALGPRARGWLIRAWGYSERSLVSTALWPPPSAGQEPETDALRDALRSAGPDSLLVCLGPKSGVLDPESLHWARGVVAGVVREWAQRVPLVRSVIVSPIWALRLRSEEPRTTPAYCLRGVRGLLVDRTGREAAPPRATLLLNGAITEVSP